MGYKEFNKKIYKFLSHKTKYYLYDKEGNKYIIEEVTVLKKLSKLLSLFLSIQIVLAVFLYLAYKLLERVF